MPTDVMDLDDGVAIAMPVLLNNRRLYGLNNGSHRMNQYLSEFSLNNLPITDIKGFIQNIDAYVVKGTSLWLDLQQIDGIPHLGSWAVGLAKAFSNVLCSNSMTDMGEDNLAPSKKVSFLDSVFLPGFSRNSIMGSSWVREMLDVAISHTEDCIKAGNLPRMIFWDDIEDLSNEWLIFERMLIVNVDGAKNSYLPFSTPELASRFRQKALQRSGLYISVANRRQKEKGTITVIFPADDGVHFANNGEILSRLRTLAGDRYSVKPYSSTMRAPLASFLAVMSSTDVLVARHGERLANAIFLHSNATVIEIAPYGCEEGKSSKLYSRLLNSAGIRHLIWRPSDPKHMVYISDEDVRYLEWNATECVASIDCREARERAAIYVDTDELSTLIKELIE